MRWTQNTAASRKAAAAIKGGKFKEEIVAVEIPAKKGDPIRFEVDEHPRESAPDKVARAVYVKLHGSERERVPT